MIDFGYLNLLFDPTFVITAIAAVFAFATIVTIGMPLMERNALGTRMKAVSERREELRAHHHAAFKASKRTLRAEPVSFMKQTVDRLKLSNLLESPDTREKLSRAGYRGQAPVVTFLFFRFVMPFIVFGAALFYLFVVTHFTWSPMMKWGAAFGAAAFGYYLPDVFVSNAIQRRQASIMQAFPDALDLLLICVEFGHVDRGGLHPRGQRDRVAVGRTRRRVRAHNGRAVLSAGPACGLRKSGQALRPFRREGSRGRAQPGREIRHTAGRRRCASRRRKIAKCGCRRPRRRPPPCRPSSRCR